MFSSIYDQFRKAWLKAHSSQTRALITHKAHRHEGGSTWGHQINLQVFFVHHFTQMVNHLNSYFIMHIYELQCKVIKGKLRTVTSQLRNPFRLCQGQEHSSGVEEPWWAFWIWWDENSDVPENIQQLSLQGKKMPWFVELANFNVTNIPSRTDFRLSSWSPWIQN